MTPGTIVARLESGFSLLLLQGFWWGIGGKLAVGGVLSYWACVVHPIARRVLSYWACAYRPRPSYWACSLHPQLLVPLGITANEISVPPLIANLTTAELNLV